MTKKPQSSTTALWARFRFSVVGSLLSAPPPRGTLKAALQSLAAKTWTHPVSAREVHLSPVTIERWYYKARQKDDPLQVLRRPLRKDPSWARFPLGIAQSYAAAPARSKRRSAGRDRNGEAAWQDTKMTTIARSLHDPRLDSDPLPLADRFGLLVGQYDRVPRQVTAQNG